MVLCAREGRRKKEGRGAMSGERTSRRVAVLEHCPRAMVLTSTLSVFMVSRIAITAYGEPPAVQTQFSRSLGRFDRCRAAVCQLNASSRCWLRPGVRMGGWGRVI